MNDRIKNLFFLIKNNRVIVVESNLKDFISQLPENLQGIRTYDYYYRKFKLNKYFEFEFNKNYIFQKVDFQKT